MKEMVMSARTINRICGKMGQTLTAMLKDEAKLPLFVCVMKGAMPFMVDLLKHVAIPVLEDYVQLESYSGTQSTGEVHLKRDIATPIDGRSVIVVEDVVDTGLTMAFLKQHLQSLGQPKRIVICALFDKKIARKIHVDVDLTGRVLNENKFLLGYGLDYNGLERNTPYVYVPTLEEVQAMDALLKAKAI